jgi:hypothetical protein
MKLLIGYPLSEVSVQNGRMGEVSRFDCKLSIPPKTSFELRPERNRDAPYTAHKQIYVGFSNWRAAGHTSRTALRLPPKICKKRYANAELVAILIPT